MSHFEIDPKEPTTCDSENLISLWAHLHRSAGNIRPAIPLLLTPPNARMKKIDHHKHNAHYE
ncbi:hypothetical protein [Rubritalea tangerina]|uniref:hypothetical protein n=1 Tax=Rubritalea tangerina TaxID=430798 RepID=UPI0036071A6C